MLKKKKKKKMLGFFFFFFFFFSYAEIAIYNLGFHWKSFQILPITAFANKTSYNGKLLNSL